MIEYLFRIDLQAVIAFSDAGIPDEFESFSITMNLIHRKNEPKRSNKINYSTLIRKIS